MVIEIVSATSYPIDVISFAAGTCYGKDDYPAKRVRSCYKAGHMSVFEHASVTFKASGISRACSHQLVSQRYCKVDVGDEWYVTPPWFSEGANQMLIDDYRQAMTVAAFNYLQGLQAGMKPEDARYMLPEACKTSITVTMNVRELFHFLDMRQDKSAQWEIRELANMLEATLRHYPAEQWGELMALRDGDAR